MVSKQASFHALAELQQSQVHKDAKEFGEEITRLTVRFPVTNFNYLYFLSLRHNVTVNVAFTNVAWHACTCTCTLHVDIKIFHVSG